MREILKTCDNCGRPDKYTETCNACMKWVDNHGTDVVRTKWTEGKEADNG